MTPSPSGVPRQITVGCRICAEDGHNGTVRYIGSVKGTSGEWYGVDWDIDGRGKHDGEHEGVRYFTSKHGRGSFIRPKKVKQSTTFVRELLNRYGLQETPNAGVNVDQLYVDDGLGQITMVEMVGAEKINKQQSNFRGMEIVVLRDALIHRLDADVNLGELTPNVCELNISKNLFANWLEVADITRRLPRLKILNVSENRFTDPDITEKLSEAFASLNTLFMNKMELSFKTALSWSEMWTGLQELHICFNGIDSLIQAGDSLRNLKLLNLEGNRLNSWNEVMHLQSLPKLEVLILNDTGLNSIDLKNREDNGFANLIEISLCSNAIVDWGSINELGRLKIKDLKLNGNPLVKTDKWEIVRDLIIAKIGTLTLLNRTVVDVEERMGADVWYLKKFGPDWLAAGGNGESGKNNPSQEFLENHPRFQELVKKYGAPEASEMYKAPKGLKDNLIQIHIKSPNKTITKKVPYTMSVQKLKTLVQKLLKADISTLTLTDIGQGDKAGCIEGKVELDNDLRDLSFYSVVHGDVIEAVWSG